MVLLSRKIDAKSWKPMLKFFGLLPLALCKTKIYVI